MKTVFYNLSKEQKEFIAKSLPEAEFTDKSVDLGYDEAEIISVFVDSHIDKKVLERFPSLKLIALRATGFDNIDLNEASKRGIKVANVPSYGEVTVAEFAFALILALSRKIVESRKRVSEEGRFSFEGLLGFDLYGKTLGVVGTGRIGKNVIKIAKGFGMQVLASDVHPQDGLAQELSFVYTDLEELLQKSDIVTLHVPAMPETRHLINRSNIKVMKRGALLVNTCRGEVVETEALVQALESGLIAGAGLDVLEEEGMIKDEMQVLAEGHPKLEEMKIMLEDHILMRMPNVLVTPHTAFQTKEALERILDTTVENIQNFTNGNPQNIVNG